MKYFWGFVLVAVGALLLGSALGYWNNVDYSVLWRLWPLILIFVGLEMITKNSPLQPLVMIVALLVSGLFVYDVLLAKNPVLKTSRERIETKTTEISAELPKEAKSARVEVNTGAIEFEIDSSTAKLLEGTLDSNVMRSDLKTTLKGDEVRAVYEDIIGPSPVYVNNLINAW